MENRRLVGFLCDNTYIHLYEEPNEHIREFCENPWAQALTTDYHGIADRFSYLMDRQYRSHFFIQPKVDFLKQESNLRFENGIRVKWVANGLKIVHVFQGSSADISGLREGDIILDVMNAPLHPYYATHSFGMFSVKRGAETLVINLNPTYYELSKNEAISFKGDTLRLSPPDFVDANWTSKNIIEIQEALERANRVVVDFRYHSGGDPFWAFQFLNLFMCDGQFLGSFETKEEAIRDEQDVVVTDLISEDFLLAGAGFSGIKLNMFASRSDCFKGKVDVLVSQETLSMAEILSVMLMSRNETKILGGGTSGAASLGVWIPGYSHGYGFFHVIPIALYRGPEGRIYEGVGIN
jgi:C-terminal processing protease CtpA/Prc